MTWATKTMLINGLIIIFVYSAVLVQVVLHLLQELLVFQDTECKINDIFEL